MKVRDELKKMRAKSLEELSKELNDLNSKLREMRKDLALDKLKKTSDIKKTKKNIARIQTVMREKLAEELEDK